MHNLTYFKDDHGRIVRVAVNGESNEVILHTMYTERGGGKLWVPLPGADAQEIVDAKSSIEALVYSKLFEKAHVCPLFGGAMPGKERVIDLDRLQQEAENLLSLLKNRQPGLATWNTAATDRFKGLAKLILKAI